MNVYFLFSFQIYEISLLIFIYPGDTQFLILFVYLESIDEKLTKNIFKINVNSAVKPWLKIDEIAKRITSDQYTSSERVDTSEWKKVIWKKLVCTQLPLTLGSFYHACDNDKIFYKISSYRSDVISARVIYFITINKWYDLYKLKNVILTINFS